MFFAIYCTFNSLKYYICVSSLKLQKFRDSLKQYFYFSYKIGDNKEVKSPNYLCSRYSQYDYFILSPKWLNKIITDISKINNINSVSLYTPKYIKDMISNFKVNNAQMDLNDVNLVKSAYVRLNKLKIKLSIFEIK